MTEKNAAILQKGFYCPSRADKFLWWLSTAEKEIIKDASIDRNRYGIIGMTVLATWIFATLVWTYFFITIVNSKIVAVLLGLFMGGIILTIDRALIKGIDKKNKRILALLFRGLLALVIGTFMAQPAVLYLFDKEIKLQISFDNEKKKMIKYAQLDSIYKNRKNNLLTEKLLIEKELENKYNEVSKARENFLAETDGSGGTGKIGIKDIAVAKRNEYQKLDQDYQKKLIIDNGKLNAIDSSLKNIEAQIKKEETNFSQYLNDGFLTKSEALNNLLKNNTALQFRYYLIIFILMLIELMPVITKSMLPAGTYDEKLVLREQEEKEIAHANIKREQELKELYNLAVFENDKEAIQEFFACTKSSRNEKIKSFAQKWQEENHQTFDGLWEKMKKEILAKQEN